MTMYGCGSVDRLENFILVNQSCILVVNNHLETQVGFLPDEKVCGATVEEIFEYEEDGTDE